MTTAPSSTRVSGHLLVVAAAFLFSTGGAAVKACTLSGWQVASFRSGVAAVAILVLLPTARRAWRPATFAVGAAYATTMILYAVANKLTTAANTIFLQGTAPLYVLLLGPWLLQEAVRRREVALMVLLAAGMTMFFVGAPPTFSTAPDPLRGNILGLLSGISWALTIMGLRWLERRGNGERGTSIRAVACGNLLAFAIALPLALPVASGRPADWATVVYLGVFQIGLAYLFLTRGVGRLGAFEVSLLLLVEPVFNPLWAWLVHGELPGPWANLGGAIIIGATAFNAWLARRGRSSGVSRGASHPR